jgi:iron complex outermembrane receptor protein
VNDEILERDMRQHPGRGRRAGNLSIVLPLMLAAHHLPLHAQTADDFDFDDLFGASTEQSTSTPRDADTATGNDTGAEAAATDAGTSAADVTNADTLETLPVEPLSPEPAPTAATKPSSKRLEEIIVVAQKKAEPIQDVPISISVIDEKFIEDWSLTDLNTAVLYTPNVKVADAGYFILPRIRGFGTDQNNKAFEPPAGVAIDGIPYTRLEYFTSALFDLARTEVYRGPQGTAFGKNTTAGLIHLITKSPTDEYEGFMDVQYGDYDRRRLEAAVGGPVIPGVVNFRIAGLSDERTGFVRNSAGESLNGAPEHGRGNSRQGVRFKLDFPDLFGSSLLLSAEKVDIEALGAGIELFDVSDAMRAAILRYDENTDFVRANYVNTINDPDYRKIALETYTAQWRYDIGNWELVGLGGYSVLDGDAALDTDISPVPAIAAFDSDVSPTTTAELRLESPELDGLLGLPSLFGLDLGSSNILAGFYYQGRKIEGDGIRYRIGLSYLDLLLASTIDNASSPVPGVIADVVAALFPLIPPIGGIADSTYSEEATQDFDQDADARAVFTQLQWQLTPTWGVEYGIRFNRETKDAHFNMYYSSNNAILLPILGVEEYEENLSLSEDNVAQRASLNFEPSEDIGIFLHWARGFRGGGFNAFSYRGDVEELVYGPESATDWGLDFKSTLLDGRMRLNVSLFRLDVDDFQVLVGLPTNSPLGIGLGGSKVENASKARSQGIEADMTWLVFDWFTLFSTFGLNDTEYLDFTTNTCFPDNKDTDGNGDTYCDATGKPFPLTPKYTGTMLGMITLPLSRSGLAMQIGGGFDYQSSQYTNTSLDDRYTQGSVTRWRATLGFGHAFDGWSFRLQGENLTDEKVTVRQGQIIKGAVVEGIEAPRTIYASFRYNFGG